MNIAVLVSGSGSNFQNIQDHIDSGYLENTQIKILIADRDCYAIQRGLKYPNIEVFELMRGEQLSTTISEICENEVDYIVLAGFLSILDQQFFDKWQNKVINIHPSLLPKYGGMGMYGNRVHRAVLENNEKESGATVHWVTPEVDEGAILKQGKFDIEPGETIESLASKVHKVEFEILIEALKELEKQ